jgi:5-methyltetrahydropteroyltriglutamate--homocysteine methyltransferase
MTAIVGSYPKPDHLFPRTGRELLDEMGMTFFELEQQIGEEAFSARLDQAALMAVEDQNAAGIDFITDGEERRGHYVLYVLRGLASIDFENLLETPIREGKYVRHLPVVIDKITYRAPIVVDDFEFTAQHTRGTVKIGLPGPSTVVDSIADAHYQGDKEQMAMDYACAIRRDVENLIEAGCRAIQFDDPVLLRYPERAKRWGLQALQKCFEGLEDQATFFVHICRGYPDKPLERKGIEYKAKADYYKDILKWLSKSTIDVVSIEGAQSNLDLSVLTAIGEKTVMLGVLDVGSEKVESVESLVERGREALQYLPKHQLILAPDCGMLQLSRAAAKEKLSNLADAVRILNS